MRHQIHIPVRGERQGDIVPVITGRAGRPELAKQSLVRCAHGTGSTAERFDLVEISRVLRAVECGRTSRPELSWRLDSPWGHVGELHSREWCKGGQSGAPFSDRRGAGEGWRRGRKPIGAPPVPDCGGYLIAPGDSP